MKKLKRFFVSGLALAMSLSICFGCSPSEQPETPDPGGDGNGEQEEEIEYGERIPAPESFLVDDFKFGAGGFTESAFYINNNLWGANNNGVKGENVSYTEDGIVLLKAYGDYEERTSYKRSGACLLSQEYFGPGKFEVAMKVMPRLGGCTAIWPFYAGTDSATGEYLYQEMDIEIPAGAEGTEVPATFEKVMNTSYSSGWSETSGGPMRTTKTETLTPANDGGWHKYTMIWETTPKPRVRYYVDDVLTSDTNDSPDGYKTVSDAKAPLQIGVWFPNGWAGDRDFEEGYALLDWVSYEPFPDQPCRESEVPDLIKGLYHVSKYPKTPVALPESNYLSDGSFESTAEADLEGNPKTPWGGDYSKEMLVDAESGGKALKLLEGEEVTQTITGVYGKTRSGDPVFGNASYYYQFDFSGSFAIEGEGSAAVKFEFLDYDGKVISSGTQVLSVTVSGKETLQVKSVDGSKAMRVTLTCLKGEAVFDDLKLIFKGTELTGE